jgi:hypothetical protein
MSLVSVHQVRPHAHILRQYTFALAASLIPLFGLLYWLAISPTVWVHLLIVFMLICLVWGLGVVGHRRAFIRVTDTAITERGFWGRTTVVPIGVVSSIIALELYRSGSLDTFPQLFVIDDEGNLLVRMRGQFWSRDDMETIVNALDVPVVRVPEPLSLRDLNRLRPELLYWFERRRPLKVRSEKAV